MPPRTELPQEEAFRRVIANRTMLRAYVYAIVRDQELAEDALSDVAVEIARSWGSYDPSRPFAPWARGVARRVALANLRRRRAGPVLLKDEALDAVGAEIDGMGDEARLETRKDLLRGCLEGLSETNRSLVRMRYFEDRSYAEISRAVKRSVAALYMAFSRIHAALFECIEGRLARSGESGPA
jgi:RNA polymerase sigma-70 factor (ECF subfamily)